MSESERFAQVYIAPTFKEAPASDNVHAKYANIAYRNIDFNVTKVALSLSSKMHELLKFSGSFASSLFASSFPLFLIALVHRSFLISFCCQHSAITTPPQLPLYRFSLDTTLPTLHVLTPWSFMSTHPSTLHTSGEQGLGRSRSDV